MAIDPALASQRDLRADPLYRELEQFFGDLHAPGEDLITDAADLAIAPDGASAAFTGTVFKDLASAPVTCIGFAELASGEMSRLPSAGYCDRMPRFSPDGQWLAFLSDRVEPGNFQLYLMRRGTDQVQAAATVEGTIEYLAYAPGGEQILLGVAGFGADMAGAQGGATTLARQEDLPDWLPRIDTGDAENLWRWLCVLDTRNGEVRRINRPGLNVWEASWLGDHEVAAICSDSHGEGSWYRSRLHVIDVASASDEVVYTPADQIGIPAGSPDGKSVAFIEAVCSDRTIYCGTLKLLDIGSTEVRSLDLGETEVTHHQWRADNSLAWCGHRAFETVVGDYRQGAVSEVWASSERTIGAWNPAIAALPQGGWAGIAEAYDLPPEIVLGADEHIRTVCSLATPATQREGFSNASVEQIRWQGRDGLEIHGWLIKPPGEGPFPLVMDIHGGPVWASRNRWMGRLRGTRNLAERGYAVFYPNPRGSSGRGQDFARLVKGDMGGEDTHDYLTGLDHLVAVGLADPARIGTTGISYGGFMSSWLITQDTRFAAAVPISPVTNWYSQHRTSQIPHFDELFLDGDASAAAGLFHSRSPAMFADRVKTPTLLLTGDNDQNTPPGQALEFHRSLLEAGVESVCLFYPNAGHGIRNYPDVIDHTTRILAWFLSRMPAV